MKYTAIKDIIFLMFSSFILKSYNTQSQRNAQKLDEPSALEKILHKTVRLDIDVIWFVKKKTKTKTQYHEKSNAFETNMYEKKIPWYLIQRFFLQL